MPDVKLKFISDIWKWFSRST